MPGSAAPAWPTEPPSYPLYPGRHVQVLNGTWDFAFLGAETPLLPAVPDANVWQQRVSVPDAFDLRRPQPRCGACWSEGGTVDEARCEQCCDRAFGQRGDKACWDPDQVPPLTFQRCCGEDPLRWRRGVAAYRAEVAVVAEAAAVLSFAGCAFRCLVAVDGVFLADHAGFSPFQVEAAAPAHGRQTRTVVVLVDNRFNSLTHPVHQRRYDWYQAGGIIRAVQFHTLLTPEPLYIAGVDVFPLSLTAVDVDLRLSLAARQRSDLRYRWAFDDDDDEGAEAGAAGPACFRGRTWGAAASAPGLRGAAVPGARPWSPESPGLHRLKVAMVQDVDGGERQLDCVEVRFGLRVVQARGREIHLNGQPLKLFGFNRHDMTDTPVVQHEELVRDIAILQVLKSNFVRGAHYAQDPRFLDLCDVHGIVLWEEVLGWQNSVEDFVDGVFMTQTLKMADELVAASLNHPSVLFYGFFNEGESHDGSPATSAAFGAVAGRLRGRSRGTKLVSWGSSAGAEDQQLRHADVCAFHAYPAWYPTTRPANLAEVQEIPLLWDAYGRWVQEHHPDKPLLITEAGASGLFGHHGPSDVKWTEEYQSLLMQMHLLTALPNPLIAGLALWQFADIPIDQNVSSEDHRPRGLNNKGVVGINRQPKVAFHALRLLRNQQPGGFVGLILPPADAGKLAGALRV